MSSSKQIEPNWGVDIGLWLTQKPIPSMLVATESYKTFIKEIVNKDVTIEKKDFPSIITSERKNLPKQDLLVLVKFMLKNTHLGGKAYRAWLAQKITSLGSSTTNKLNPEELQIIHCIQAFVQTLDAEMASSSRLIGQDGLRGVEKMQSGINKTKHFLNLLENCSHNRNEMINVIRDDFFLTVLELKDFSIAAKTTMQGLINRGLLTEYQIGLDNSHLRLPG
jgi:hypothetical protein